MNHSFTQALLFLMVVFFGLSIGFSMAAHYKERPVFKKIGILFMVLLAVTLVVALLGWFASI